LGPDLLLPAIAGAHDSVFLRRLPWFKRVESACLICLENIYPEEAYLEAAPDVLSAITALVPFSSS
jgi:hypothetical protein